MHITVETAGVVFKPVACDLMSISPKLSNAAPRDPGQQWQANHQETTWIDLDCIQRLMAVCEYQLKFVVISPEDLAEIEQLLDQLGRPDPTNVLLMPEGTDRETLQERATWLVDLCKQTGYRYCPRLQIELFGHRRGV